ncbi:SGNH/GDSL hydrolase family protein [Pradoshia eiseniae]|nr:GDSL-type esterase/lipase family protein [Pradoshia eiseniae]
MKIVILGDSISEGIGKKKHNYAEILQQDYKDIEIVNLALTGTTIKYALGLVDEINKINPDIIFVCYGNVDAILRPITNKKFGLYNLVPRRYRNNGMLDPRAFISRKKLKGTFQLLESHIRYNIKKILLKTEGTYCWTELELFREIYNQFLERVSEGKRREILLISTVTINDKYFPGSTKQFELYNSTIKQIALEHGYKFIDIYNILKKYPRSLVYGNDHFHPVEEGYRKIAEVLSEEIDSIIKSHQLSKKI